MLAAFALASPVAFGKALEKHRWIELRTPNFLVRSLLNDKETIELARKLETFRVVASILTNTELIESPVPTVIYALGNASITKSFGLPGNVAGIFNSGLRNNTIVLRNTFGMDDSVIIMHEYVHFLLRNHNGLNYPTWFNEGFAEYLSATRIDGETVTVGAVPKHRLSSFHYQSWIPMQSILSAEDLDKWGAAPKAMFYAEAWALVHYLQHRKDSDEPFGREMAHYLTLVDSGKDSVEAFEQAFGITTQRLDNAIQRYVGGYAIPGLVLTINDPLSGFDPEVKILSREEISLHLGQAALGLGGPERAEHWFEVAATDSDYRPRAEAGLGDVLKLNDELEAAEPHYERAVELAPDDPYCHLDFAEYWHYRAEKSDDEASRAQYIAKARQQYVRAWTIDHSIPEVYAMYGESFLIGNQNFAKATQMLEEAQHLLPSSIRVRAALAEAYLGANRFDEAATMARSALAWSHGDPDVEKRAQDVLDKLAVRSKRDPDSP